MRKNNVILFLTFFLLISSFFTEGTLTTMGSEKKVKQLVYAAPYDIVELNAFIVWSDFTRQWLSPILLGLFHRDPNKGREFTPTIAEDYPVIEKTNRSVTGFEMKVTVTLKKGVKFSDGAPLTAEDVKYTYQLHMTPKTNSMFYKTLKSCFGSNDSIIVIDDYKIQFNFIKQNAFYLKYLSLGILPKATYQPAVENKKYSFDDEPEKFLVSAGPYKLESIGNDNVTLIKNPYWNSLDIGNKTLDVDRLVFKTIFDKDKALEQFSKGKVDILDGMFKIYKLENKIKHLQFKNITGFYHKELAINNIHPVWGHTAQLDAFLNKTFYYHDGSNYTVSSFWDKISNHKMNESMRIEAARLVREAISYIIPRENISKELYLGFAVPASTIMPSSSIGWDPNLKPREYSVEKAREKILEAFSLAGWTNITTDSSNTDQIFVGDLMKYFEEWSIVLMGLVSCGSLVGNILLNMTANNLALIGINVPIKIGAGWDVFYPRTFGYKLNISDYNLPSGIHKPVPLFDGGGFDSLFISYFWDIDWDPTGLYETWSFIPKGNNFYNWWDPNYDNLLKAYTTELDPVIRTNYVKKIQQYLYKWEPTIPMLFAQQKWLYREGIKGIDFVLLSYAQQPWWQLTYSPPLSQNVDTTTGNAFLNTPLLTIIVPITLLIVVYYVKKKSKK